MKTMRERGTNQKTDNDLAGVSIDVEGGVHQLCSGGSGGGFRVRDIFAAEQELRK